MEFFRYLFLLSASVCFPLSGDALEWIDKPAVQTDILPLPVQNETYPKDARENPFVETAPAVIPTAEETASCMLIFSRPLTDPVWAETRPQPYERISSLNGWGAKDQFVTLNFAVYPLKELKNLRLDVQGCQVKPEVRLVRYWDIIYPRYDSHALDPDNKQYRRMPEFLAPANGCDKVPALEPQRFLLTFRLPKDGTGELSGNVILSHDGFDKAVKLPFRVKVLPIDLKQDPNKHYSAYNYHVRTNWSPFYQKYKNNPEFLHKIQLEEFIRMREYGFTRPPVLDFALGTLPDGTADAYCIPYMSEILPELREAGFPESALIPVSGSSHIPLYNRFTGHKLKDMPMNNIECERIPESLYTYMGNAMDKYLAYAKANNYPSLIYNPVDEPCTKSLPYVRRIYEIFKSRGLTTFQTSPPVNFIREADSLFDIYNYGNFDVSYEEASSGHKKEYWCYPNDNAFQIKDPDIMCHGGRIVYGLGYWRSGFHCILPWIWHRPGSARIGNAGGNLRLDDGTLLMTTYWECFRLGVDDMRYIYTLQDAVVKRENSKDPQTRAAVAEAGKLLQDVWNSIYQQTAYLKNKLIPHCELDGRRAQIANMILKLQKYPAVNEKIAPSVIIDPKGKYKAKPEFTGGRNVIRKEIGNWSAFADEIKVRKVDGGWNATVKIDHTRDGAAPGGKSLVGWPRMQVSFSEALDLSRFAYLEFDLTVQSDRDAQSDYYWPLRLGIGCGKPISFVDVSSGLVPKAKHKIRIPLANFFSQESVSYRSPVLEKGDLSNVRHIQFVVFERMYPHGVTLNFKFGKIYAVGYTAPVITGMDAPAVVALPVSGFSVPAAVEGIPDGKTVKAVCELISRRGRVVAKSDGIAINGRILCGVSGKGLKPGTYTLRLTLPAEKRKGVVPKFSQKIVLIKGPDAQ